MVWRRFVHFDFFTASDSELVKAAQMSDEGHFKKANEAEQF